MFEIFAGALFRHRLAVERSEMADLVSDLLIVCARANVTPQTDAQPPPTLSQCVDCRALVWKPVNAPPHTGCLCAYCNANGRPQRPGSTV